METSSGLMMNNCGGDEGISTHQSSHIVNPMITHSPLLIVLFDIFGVVAKEISAVSHNKPLMWGHCGLIPRTALSIWVDGS